MSDDPELQEIFTDPSHQEVVDLLKSSRPGTPPIDPHFRGYLRAKLMTEAQRTLPQRASRSWLGLSFRPRTLAMSMAAVAAGFLVVLGVQVYLRNGPVPTGTEVAVRTEIANKTDVATAAEPIRLEFKGPVDKNAVAESVVIEPATAVTKQWVGSTLVITPDHALAPNTNYTVKLQPRATAASPAPSARTSPTAAPTPLVVHFSTVRAPVPPVTPPSFASGNVTYGHDTRLADAGTVLNGTWTAGGQLLVTRPAGQQGAAATASASASPSPAASTASTTDVWLMSPLGTPIRNVAPGATLPSTPASGSMFAAWSLSGSQAKLDVRDLQGNLIATVATLTGKPERAATWVGTDRLAYVDGGVLKLIDLHGVTVAIPELKVQQGSLDSNPSGSRLAVEAADGSVVLDLTASPVTATRLHQGATGFAWSPKNDLGFLVQHGATTDLYVGADSLSAVKVAGSPQGQRWFDLNWSPDAASLLLAVRGNQANAVPGLLLINRDGSSPRTFGASQREYAAPQWSPAGDLVLFMRHDDATGGITFQLATASTSGANAAEQQALAEVDRFMQARLAGDNSAAQAELDSNGQAAYHQGNAALMPAAGTHFQRYYPVTVQLAASKPNTFLIGVRSFIARQGGPEISFVEEQLTVIQQDQRYVIHDVQSGTAQPLGHGPTVVSVEVSQTPPGQQVKVRFDADVKAESITSGTIKIKDASGDVVDAQVSFDADNHMALLSAKLRPGTYQLVVTTAVTDINGMPLAHEYDAPLVISR